MSERVKILFVCALNMMRSPTAEYIYRNDPRLDVRSAGTRPGAQRRISESDLNWADVVFVMERDHKQRIQEEFQGMELPRIEVLGIADDFEYLDAELIALLKQTLDPEIEEMVRRPS